MGFSKWTFGGSKVFKKFIVKIELNIVINKLSYDNLLIMPSKLYFKITKDEYHYGFQNVNGLNISQEESNNNPNECTSVRLCFTKPKYIYKFLDYGIYLWEVSLPTDNPEFKMFKILNKNEYVANMILLGKRRDFNWSKY
ncbi:hypothetical protein H012_gp494 [Acanthamoeba polyphaga moumouvirus]|uniref:Uncharacterized protein n=1 Tax=Acanthamoeba polyphaga moumouvirus TaxID=1269028 RepID=L7RCK0_9VIRU|nr:hypothetical protein H012_gp494 [Acanthamoeba polyphaga moumouvirus]AGC01966.1 hypothetical protein Moumou_00430 [Acanthamoeba polyphaga moumouvirus]